MIGGKRVTAKHSSSSQSDLSFAAAAAAAAEFFYWLVRKAGIRAFVDFRIVLL